MQFPYFQFPWLGDGLVIGINAIIHVFVSHGVSIGLVGMVVLAEYMGWRKGDARWEGFARAAIKPTVIIVTGLGAMTGVGIWFTTSAMVPNGIGSMLRVFFWPWFIEWIVFATEVVVLVVYYFTWEAWSGRLKKRHVSLGIAYMGLAGLSALLITGILGFMLTSDGWPWDKSLWGAFFNPTFLPQLAWRLSEGLAMGAAFAMVFLLFWHQELTLRRPALRLYATVLVGAAVPMAVSGWWWFHVVPSSFKTHAAFAFQMMTGLRDTPWFWGGHLVLMGLVALVVVAGWLRSGGAAKFLVLPATLAVLVFAAEFEWVREFIRGPYLMPGYMYANTVLLSEHELFRQEGMLKHAYWYNQLAHAPSLEEEGAFLFARNCGTCHTIGGRNDILARIRGRPEDGVLVILGRTEQMIPFMPAFSGSGEERARTARFLSELQRGAVQLGEFSRYLPVSGQEQQ